MRLDQFATITLLSIVLSGCQMPKDLSSLTSGMLTGPANDVPINEADFAAYAKDGNAKLDGQAFLRLSNGGVKSCAGSEVLLAPATDYDLKVMNKFLFSRLDSALQYAGPAAKYWRESQCDVEGKFSFEDLPAGKWVVLTEVTFDTIDQGLVLKNLTSGGGLADNGVEGINEASTVRKGGLMGRTVTVKEKGHNKIILTQENLKSALMFGAAWPN